MALFDTDKAGVLWDSVALPNAFICEYMPVAPEGYVKVYLYGLMYSRFPSMGENLTAGSLAKELGMAESDVLQAFRYWERCRLIRRTQDNPPSFTYLSVQQAMIGRQNTPDDEEYMQFAQALYAIFGDRRKLHGGETQLCYEWVEQLGLPREVVLMMVQHLATTRGVNFSFKEAQKLAVELCERHVTTLDQAEQYFSRSESAWKGTGKVLRRMSKFRAPTMDEIDLYLKWTKDWGFSPKAIETACVEMTGGDPSFKYLDAILKGIHERGSRKLTSTEQLKQQLAEEKNVGDAVREVLAAAGLSQSANSAGTQAVYRDMLTKMSHETIVMAAGVMSKRTKSPSLDKLVALVDTWRDNGLTSPEAVDAYLAEVKRDNATLRGLFKRMGYEGAPNAGHRAMLQKWRVEWRFGDALLDKAADYSAQKAMPPQFMDKVLEGWHDNGVTTIEAAILDHDKHLEHYAPKAAGGKPTKTVIEQRYEQRDYDPNEFDGPSAEEIEEASKL